MERRKTALISIAGFTIVTFLIAVLLGFEQVGLFGIGFTVLRTYPKKRGAYCWNNTRKNIIHGLVRKGRLLLLNLLEKSSALIGGFCDY